MHACVIHLQAVTSHQVALPAGQYVGMPSGLAQTILFVLWQQFCPEIGNKAGNPSNQQWLQCLEPWVSMQTMMQWASK